MIPPTVHIVWIGDESRRPDNCINTWSEKNPGWTVKLWGNHELDHEIWVNSEAMRLLRERGAWCGIADLMRYEILYREGGITQDADSRCLRPLSDWLRELDSFACWENELARPGLIAVGTLGACAGNAFFGQLIFDIERHGIDPDLHPWQTVGPMRITKAYHDFAYANLTILPSHMFMPHHFAGLPYTGGGPVFAEQFWCGTPGGMADYEELKHRNFDLSMEE